MSTHQKIVCFVLFVTMTSATFFSYGDVYVSTTGDDSHPGTKDQPVRTLHQAIKCVRQQIAQTTGTPKPINVWIASGTYTVDKTIELGRDDSGTESAPICYRAEPGAEVRLMGGRLIPPEAFQPVTDSSVVNRLDPAARGHVFQVDLKALKIINLGEIVPGGCRPDLLFNDQPLTLARWPNKGFVNIADVTNQQPINSHGIAGSAVGQFIYEGNRPERWTAETDLYLQGYWFWEWSSQYHKVASIDTKNHTISLVPPYHKYGYRKGQSYCAINALAELDMPGEWYIDRQKGVLYVWPPSPIDKARVVFTTLESPVILLKDTSYVTLRDLIVEASRGEGIIIVGGHHNLIAGCTVRNLGSTGVAIRGGTNNGVLSCNIYRIESGINVYGGDRRTLTPAGNYATNNHIYQFGRLQRTYMPAIGIDGVGNRADHNLINDAPHWAVSFSGNENIMEFNEIHDVCYETGDVGVFYTGRDWTVRGNVIRYNFIHHVSGLEAGKSQGVYLDDAASGTIVFGNVIYKTMRAMLLGGGRDNQIENNLMLACGQSLCFDNRGMNWMQDHIVDLMPKLLAELPYRQPPWSEKYPQLLKLLEDEPGIPKGNVIRLNVIHPNKPMELAPEVSKFGTIVDNLITDEDLGFQDAARMDFRLREDSVVFKKLPKFQQIPFEKIGLYVDEYRKSLPPRRADSQ